VVSDPLAAERAVEVAEETHDEAAVKQAKAIRRRTYLFEAALILVAYFLYSWVRGLVHGHQSDAEDHARHIIDIEKALGIYHERALNHFVAHQHWLAYICNYWYAIMHFAATIAVAIWVYRSHPAWARQFRTAFYCMNALALIGFAFIPVAPPRLLPGGNYIDTVVKFHTWGSWGDKNVSKDANLYAAMPSMHIGWSMFVAAAMVLLARRAWVRIVGALYPLAQLFVIVGTANHYILDAVGGVVAFVIGVLLAHLIYRRRVLPRFHWKQPAPAPR
jgi:hypothetical protein